MYYTHLISYAFTYVAYGHVHIYYTYTYLLPYNHTYISHTYITYTCLTLHLSIFTILHNPFRSKHIHFPIQVITYT